MILIIKNELVNPPTWFSSFRDLTLICSSRLHADIIIETEWENVDIYYHWLKSKGGMDYIDDFVPIGIENGIRLDTEFNYSPTILTDRIVPENTHQLFRKIMFSFTF